MSCLKLSFSNYSTSFNEGELQFHLQVGVSVLGNGQYTGLQGTTVFFLCCYFLFLLYQHIFLEIIPGSGHVSQLLQKNRWDCW